MENNKKSPRKKLESFYAWDEDTLILNILGTPNAKRDEIGKPKGNQLCISVTAFPRLGKATDYMVKYLAGEFGVKPSDIEVVFGRMNVNKQIRIHAPQRLPAILHRYEKKRKQHEK